MLSYSPKQEVHSFAERALMPVIFAELATTYRPREVSDPDSLVAAANGQYLLIRRDAYDAVGGHAAVAQVILEDVELARRVKRARYKLQFRLSDAVSTRMYRNLAQMWEGWTKNLALLFPNARGLALRRAVEFLLIAIGVLATLNAVLLERDPLGIALNTSLRAHPALISSTGAFAGRILTGFQMFSRSLDCHFSRYFCSIHTSVIEKDPCAGKTAGTARRPLHSRRTPAILIRLVTRFPLQ